ncbi:uncharacterized protein LOC117303959 [Asterias rubens]|uniref:uncharacterized protein LOC117303959 n=1 Tax=Asterias rubens TaxID=7604 RepID=UPI00145571B1|nr:uncharacterized protein LOC117303959 [Asterias rubens]
MDINVREKQLDGCYTRMLRQLLGVGSEEHNQTSISGSPSLASKATRVRFAGHCYRHPELPASKLVLWEPKQGQAQRGRGRLTYVDLLKKDTGFVTAGEVSTCMGDRKTWRNLSLYNGSNNVSGVIVVSSYQICHDGLECDITSNNPHCWVLPSMDPCEYAAVLGGLTAQNVSHRRQGAPYYLDKIVERLHVFFGCQDNRKDEECFDPEPLGLEDGSIPDSGIRVSSTQGAGRGRLNGYAWLPLYVAYSWIEVDLGVSTVVSGVMTQGGMYYRVTRYRVRYKKLQSSDFNGVKDSYGNITVFDGNIDDAKIPVTNMFDQSIMATIVRIETVAYKHGIALRLELLGCYTEVE